MVQRGLLEWLRAATDTRRGRRSGSRSLGRPSPAAAALAVTLILGAQWLGGALPLAMVATTVLALGALGLALRETPRQPAGTSSWLLAPMLLALCWTVIQALPLPCPLVDWLAPDAAQHYRRALSLVVQPAPDWCTLSRDPGATRAEILKGCAIVCTYLAATLLVRAGHRRWVLIGVAAASACVALVALAHGVLGAERIFGVYAPEQLAPSLLVFGPIVNPNNLGGYAAMGVPLLLGLAERGRGPMGLWLALALAAFLVAFLSLSRGAVGAALVGLTAYLVLSRVRTMQGGRPRGSERRKEWRSGQLAVAGGGLAALSLGVYAIYDEFVVQLEQRDLSKLELIRAGALFALKQPWVGAGRGAFNATFVGHVGTSRRYEYAENFVVQWLSEWGWPVACVLLVAFGRAAWDAVRRITEPGRLGATLALLCIALQNLVDLGFELVGLAVGVAALASAVFEQSPVAGRGIALDVRRTGAVLVGATLFALILVGPGVLADHAIVQARELTALRGAGERQAFQARLAEAVESHPSDPTFTLLAATEATHARDPRAGRWISRTMELAPQWVQPHALAAAWLWQMGHREQAVIELGEAARRDVHFAMGFTCKIGREAPMLALRAAPSRGPARATFLDRLARCLPAESAGAEAADRLLAAEAPQALAPKLRLAQRLLQRDKALEAVALTRALARQHPAELSVQLSLVDALAAAGELDEAVLESVRGEGKLQDPYPLVRRRMEIESRAGKLEAMRATAEQLRRLAAGQAGRLAEALDALAREEARHGQLAHALRAAQEAKRIAPTTGRLNVIAGLLRKLGDRHGLYRVLSEICALEPGGRACKARDELAKPAARERRLQAAQPSE